MSNIELLHGDCLEVMKTLPDNSVDSIVTDPPYGLSKEPDIKEVLTHWLNGNSYEHKGGGFMGKTWDSFVPSPAIWQEAYRVLKPGGHMLAFFGTRTYDLGVIAIRLAGFEVRDTVAWVYGSGFPKSHNVSKAIQKQQGEAPLSPNAGKWNPQHNAGSGFGKNKLGDVERFDWEVTTPKAKQWDGWGTALKPAFEPIVLARKPFKGTVAANVLEHGTGALNIDGCRVGFLNDKDKKEGQSARVSKTTNNNGYALHHGGLEGYDRSDRSAIQGRWPANFIHDGSDEVLEFFPQTNTGDVSQRKGMGFSGGKHEWQSVNHKGDSGSAARFFYCAKASKRDRDEGLPEGVRSTHPTVKPLALCQYLVRLITPLNGTVLDPFMGSGSTGKACAYEGFDFIGIEQDAEYLDIARARIAHAVETVKPDEPETAPLFMTAHLEAS